MSWQTAWAEGRTPWDAGSSAPLLTALVTKGEVTGRRALVPGCGSGYDVLTLAGGGITTLGIDLAQVAVQRFEALRCQAGLSARLAQCRTADFFVEPFAEPFDLVWDYTFLCALDPAQRPAWAKRMAEVIASGGELLTLLFPVDAGRDPHEGPPYALNPDQVESSLAPYFARASLAPASLSHKARLGREWLGRWRRH